MFVSTITMHEAHGVHIKIIFLLNTHNYFFSPPLDTEKRYLHGKCASAAAAL